MGHCGQTQRHAKLVTRQVRPPEELYDVNADPFEINNLANNPKYAKKLKEMRRRLNQWMKKTDDKGRQPESARMFDSDMKVYLDTIKKRSTPEHYQTIADNIAVMKKWAAEGK